MKIIIKSPFTQNSVKILANLSVKDVKHRHEQFAFVRCCSVRILATLIFATNSVGGGGGVLGKIYIFQDYCVDIYHSNTCIHVVDQPTCDFILNMAWFVNSRHPC